LAGLSGCVRMGGARWRPGVTSARRRGCGRRWGEWRGPPLADVAFEPFAAPEVARLEDLRAAAVEDRVEADLAMGRGAELEELVAAKPLRERLRAPLTLALYRAGRQGEALDARRNACASNRDACGQCNASDHLRSARLPVRRLTARRGP
jgi:DNA-binding SARP family transcriptional activator